MSPEDARNYAITFLAIICTIIVISMVRSRRADLKRWKEALDRLAVRQREAFEKLDAFETVLKTLINETKRCDFPSDLESNIVCDWLSRTLRSTDISYSVQMQGDYILIHIKHDLLSDDKGIIATSGGRQYVVRKGVILSAALGLDGLSGLEFMVAGRNLMYPTF